MHIHLYKYTIKSKVKYSIGTYLFYFTQFVKVVSKNYTPLIWSDKYYTNIKIKK